MDVFYFASDSFVSVAATSMISLMENNKNAEKIRFYLVDDGISDENKEMLSKMIVNYEREIHYIPSPDPCDAFHFHFKSRYQMGHSYMRMCVGSLLPSDMERVLCLDSDTLILGDLTPLWNMEMGDSVIAGVPEMLNMTAYRHQFHLKNSDYYCNAGVLLIDLKKWREQNLEEEIVSLIQENNGNIFFFEQTLMNYVCRGKILPLSTIYNCGTNLFAFSYENLMRWRRPSIYFDRKLLEEAMSNPVILHFTRCFYMQSRPWVQGCKHPKTEVYLRYKRLTPWPDCDEDESTFWQHLKYRLWHLLPESYTACIAGCLYNDVRPLMRWRNE